MPVATPDSYPGTPGTPLYAGRVTPGAPPSFAVANELRISSVSGTETNYPYQFGRPFRLGEIANFPKVLINGTPVDTQADVKTRHGDGSVKFAVISIVVPSLPTSETVLTFVNQASVVSTPETIVNMLADYDFEATIGIAVDGTPVADSPVSARAMLTALSDASLAAETAAAGVDARYWTQGPICTTVLLHNHTAKTYDIGTNATKAIRPMFIVQFWPTLGKYHVRHIIEGGDVTKLKDELNIDVTFTTGQAAPATRLSQLNAYLYAATFFSRAYWGGTDVPRCNTQHGRAFLSDAKVMPNYNPSITMNSAATASWGTDWAGKAKTHGSAGYWRKDMPGTGGAFMIGMLPKWDVVAFNTGAAHMHEIGEAQCDLAGAWALYFREGSATKTTFGSVLGNGRIVSKLSRPTQFLSGSNVQINNGTAVGDRFTLDGTLSTVRDGWNHDDAHQPGLFWYAYLTTGSAFWHEKLLQVAAWAQFLVNAGGTGYQPGQNGGTLTDIVASGSQGRGYGWVLRNRARAWWLALDGSPEKDLMDRALHDMIAQRVGVYDVAGSMVGDRVRDSWNTNYASWYRVAAAAGRPNTFAYMEPSGPYAASQITNNTVTAPTNMKTPSDSGEASWMRNISAMCAHSVADLGYSDVQPLADFLSKQTIETAAGGAPRLCAYFATPCTKTDNTFYQSLSDLSATWSIDFATASYPSQMPVNSSSGFGAGGGPNTWTVVLDTYGAIAASAIGAANESPNQAAAWTAIGPWSLNSAFFDHDPTWSIIPRT